MQIKSPTPCCDHKEESDWNDGSVLLEINVNNRIGKAVNLRVFFFDAFTNTKGGLICFYFIVLLFYCFIVLLFYYG